MRHYKSVIFDLDGTLLYTLEDLMDSVNYALDQKNYPLRTLEEVRKFIGHGVLRLIKCAVPNTCSESEIMDTFQIFKEHYATNVNNKTRPYDGILPLLETLQEQGYQLAIVSNKLDPQVKKLNELYFSKYITVAIGETKERKKKPAPDTIMAALSELGCQPEESIYVGDSEVDIETARNSNMDCVSVSWGFREKDILIEHGASNIIDQPEQLLTILN